MMNYIIIVKLNQQPRTTKPRFSINFIIFDDELVIDASNTYILRILGPPNDATQLLIDQEENNELILSAELFSEK
jgi:hypothetical protein